MRLLRMARCYPCRQVRAIHGRVGHTRRLVEARSIIRSEWFETDIGRGEDKIFGPNVSQLEYYNQKRLCVRAVQKSELSRGQGA